MAKQKQLNSRVFSILVLFALSPLLLANSSCDNGYKLKKETVSNGVKNSAGGATSSNAGGGASNVVTSNSETTSINTAGGTVNSSTGTITAVVNTGAATATTAATTDGVHPDIYFVHPPDVPVVNCEVDHLRVLGIGNGALSKQVFFDILLPSNKKNRSRDAVQQEFHAKQYTAGQNGGALWRDIEGTMITGSSAAIKNTSGEIVGIADSLTFRFGTSSDPTIYDNPTKLSASGADIKLKIDYTQWEPAYRCSSEINFVIVKATVVMSATKPLLPVQFHSTITCGTQLGLDLQIDCENSKWYRTKDEAKFNQNPNDPSIKWELVGSIFTGVPVNNRSLSRDAFGKFIIDQAKFNDSVEGGTYVLKIIFKKGPSFQWFMPLSIHAPALVQVPTPTPAPATTPVPNPKAPSALEAACIAHCATVEGWSQYQPSYGPMSCSNASGATYCGANLSGGGSWTCVINNGEGPNGCWLNVGQ